MIGVLWLLAFQLLGELAAAAGFAGQQRAARLWLGSVLGLAAAMWAPIPFAFAFGFSPAAHWAGLGAAALLCAGMCLILQGTRKHNINNNELCKHINIERESLGFLALAGALLLVCLWILVSHTLYPRKGALYTGQCTYGDMAMHLGFITSMAEQRMFPPFYSILPQAKLCYPFLCDSVSASLYLLGTGLSAAYILPMAIALADVFAGVWFLCKSICREKGAALLGWTLFFFCGGFGTLYFLGKYSFTDLFTGFYKTPTNLTPEGIRWVNVVVDMLLPQRATLFGWSLLMACLWLLVQAVFLEHEQYFLPAGILGGLLPMVHTHSYLALGLCAACWMLGSLLQEGMTRRWWKHWLLFGIPAVALALPQVLFWTMDSVGGNSQFLRLNLDWVNGLQENWFLFWLKNLGPLFLVFPAAYFTRPVERRMLFSPALLIFVLCEVLVFQPNVYDNNKLMYIGWLLVCLCSADAVLHALRRFVPQSLLRGCVLGLLILLCTNAAVLSLGREAVSGMDGFGYRLFSAEDVEAAEFIRQNTAPDAKFLTADHHDNTVAVLTGRNILCGSSSYLYYHGLDYRPTQQLQKAMLQDPEVFLSNWETQGIDYVFISRHERAAGPGLAQWLQSNAAPVFQNADVSIYDRAAWMLVK